MTACGHKRSLTLQSGILQSVESPECDSEGRNLTSQTSHPVFAPADAVAFGVGAEVDPAERQG